MNMLSFLCSSIFLWLAFGPIPTFGFVHRAIQPRRLSSTVVAALWRDNDDGLEKAEVLPLSPSDRARLQDLQSRQRTMPILFLDAMVPKQQLVFQSSDVKFKQLLSECLALNYTHAGMFGLNPTTRRPLSYGVSFRTDASTIRWDASGLVQLTVTATAERLEVQGEPWLDPTKSFYLARVEVVSKNTKCDDDDDGNLLTTQQRQQTRQLSETLPDLVREWKECVLQSGKTNKKGLKARCDPLGPMPSRYTDRALWIAALINPLPPLGVALEIRPAMLAAENDYERILLACESIQGSIDHLTGVKKLF